MREFRSIAAAFAVLLVFGACKTEKFHTRIERAWPAEQVSEVKLRGINGRVQIEAAPRGTVSLVADISASGRPGREAIERGLIDTRLDGDTLLIRERTLSKKMIEILPFFHTGHVKINYRLTLPESTDLSVVTTNGRIESTGVSGFLNLETVNGSIRVTTPRGQLDAKTVNGSIRANFTEQFRGAQLRTVNGSIRLTVPASASIDAQVDQVNGAFKTNIPVSVSSSPGHRESEGAINGGEFPLEISTVNGSVSLERLEGAQLPDPAPSAMPELPGLPEVPSPPAPPAIPSAPSN